VSALLAPVTVTVAVVPAPVGHKAVFVPSSTAPNLVSVVCACGRSSFGSMLPDSAADAHAQHAARPTDGSFREPEPTRALFGDFILALAAHPSTRHGSTTLRRHA
jgi:hypothetical protein